LILLISTGFGIVNNQIRYPWLVLGGPSLLFILQSIVVLAMLHREGVVAISVVRREWLTLWYFAFVQIDSNSKILLTQAKANPSSPEDTREELSHEDIPFAKRTLYRYRIKYIYALYIDEKRVNVHILFLPTKRRFAIIFALYFILLFLVSCRLCF
jgi:hypothetical protein